MTTLRYLLLYCTNKNEQKTHSSRRVRLSPLVFFRFICEQVVALRSRVETLLPSTCISLAEPETGCVVKDKHENGIHQVCHDV